MPPKVIREWYDLAREFGVALVLDETYRDFVEGENGERGKPHDLFGLEDWGSTLVSLGSFSSGCCRSVFQ
jgi:aspartate/methionine/tyrosine aminotransferase